MKIKEQYPTTPVIDLLPKCYKEEREELISQIRFKSLTDFARCVLVKKDDKIYVVKFRDDGRVNFNNRLKIFNATYKVIKNSYLNSFKLWIDFHNATAGQYKVGDDILFDLDG